MIGSVVVTSNVFTGYSRIFTLDIDININLLQFDNQLTCDALPFDSEIKYEIFERLVLQLIKDKEIRKAFWILLNVNFEFMRHFYIKFISKIMGVSRDQVIKHVSGLYDFIRDINDSVFSGSNKRELYLQVYCRNPQTIDPINMNWPFGSVTEGLVEDLGAPAVNLTEHLGLKCINTGPYYCDLVWLSGKDRDGILEVDIMKSPVLLLEVYSRRCGMEQTLSFQDTTFFNNVIKMLKICLGEYSGVFLVQTIPGAHCLLTEVLPE